jgi:exosortase family protein XrtF
MISGLLKNKFSFFLIKAALMFVAWYLFYELYIQKHTKVDLYMINFLIIQSQFVISLLGYPLIERPYDEIYRTMGIDGSNGVWIGDSCNGLTLFATFTIFILAYPGPIRKKIWFIPLGILIVHLFNVLRIVALSIIAFYRPEWLDFNHTYTFQILLYFIIFLLWIWWANKLSQSIKKT